MGSSESKPVYENENLGYVAVVIQPGNEINLLNSPAVVVEKIVEIAKETIKRVGKDVDEEFRTTKKEGYHKLTFGSFWIFGSLGLKEATYGKFFIIRLFEEMYKLGYDPVVCADLSRRNIRSTIYFKRVSVERTGIQLMCLSTEDFNKVVFMRDDEDFYNIVKDAVTKTWTKGIQSDGGEKSEEIGEERYRRLKLNDDPWFKYEGSEDYVRSREMLLKILGELGENGYRLFSAVNIFGKTHSFLFLKEMNHKVGEKDMFVLSLDQSSKLRFIGYPNPTEMLSELQTTITSNDNSISERTFVLNHLEVKLEGSPWHTESKEDALRSRRLICRIGEFFLAKGWALVEALDISQDTSEDKSVLLLTRCLPFKSSFACFSMTGNESIVFQGFPVDDVKVFFQVIRATYMPGVREQNNRNSGEDCKEYEMQIKMASLPWFTNDSVNLHAKSMLCELLKVTDVRGWTLVCSADLSEKKEVHSWYFTYWPTGRRCSA